MTLSRGDDRARDQQVWVRLVTSWVPREHVSDTVKAAFVQGRLTKDELEALATGADPLHLALVFNIDHTNAMAYANAARNLLSSPAEQALLSASRAAK